MNWRTTLVLAAITLGVLAYLRFVEMKQPSTEEAKRQAQNVVTFDRNKINGIVIQNGDEKIEMRRRDNRWRLETPIKDETDSSLIENLLSELENWQRDGTISAKEIEAAKHKLTKHRMTEATMSRTSTAEQKPPDTLVGQ